MVDFTAFETDELDLVLRHETAHAKQWHTLDLLLVELVGVACWFNPFVWAYRDARNYADMLAVLGRYAEAVALYDSAFYHRSMEAYDFNLPYRRAYFAGDTLLHQQKLAEYQQAVLM
ncbi:MAG: hypothetical protein IKZ52_01915 [Bacteroidales bacterium]|nr:hypothetical protein [Bacteroidales bacterium]